MNRAQDAINRAQAEKLTAEAEASRAWEVRAGVSGPDIARIREAHTARTRVSQTTNKAVWHNKS